MHRFTPLLSVVFVLAAGVSAQSAFSQEAQRRDEPPANSPQQVAADLPEAVDEPTVLRFLYGNYDARRQAAIAEAGEPSLPGRSAAEGVAPVLATVEGLYRYPPAAPDHLLVVVAENPEGADSHGQAPALGAALFEKVSVGWALRVRKDDITEMGSYGRAPEGELVQLGPARWGVRYTPGFTNMGESVVGLSLLAPVGGSIVELLSLGELEGDNSGGCDEAEKNCYDYKSQVRFEPRRDAEWFDVVVTTAGSRLSDEMTSEKFRETHRYRFTGSVYEEERPSAARR